MKTTVEEGRPRAVSEPRSASSSLRLGPQPWNPVLGSQQQAVAVPATPMTIRQGQGQEIRETGTRGKSCQAIINAVSSLYRLDDFVKEEIGHGFFSDVYKVTHKVTGDVMVLKMNTSSNNRPNVLREVQLLNKLQHPNILRLLGVCVHEGQLHALTEYINAGSLEQLLADKPLPLSWTLRVSLAADIARGMCYLHSRGFMHRDLTSKNILIRDRGTNRTELTAIVADLGLATKIPDPLNEAGKQLPVVGSPWWMAPECIHGKRYCEKADMFSYGIILCEIIARIESDPDVLLRSKNFGLDYIAFSEKVQTSDCPLDFLHMALTCCKFEPKERLSFMQVIDILEDLLTRPLDDLEVSTVNTEVAKKSEELPNGIAVEVVSDRGDQSPVSTAASVNVKDVSQVPDDLLTTPAKRRLIQLEPVPMTPLAVGKGVSYTDRHYTPFTKNPFHDRFRHYTKLTGCSMENWMYWCDSMSRTSMSSLETLVTPPGSPISLLDTVDEWDYYAWSMTPRESVSLPSSPELSRRELIYSRESSEFFGSDQQAPACGGIEPLPFDGFEDADARSDISTDSALELESLLNARKYVQHHNIAAAVSRKLEALDRTAMGQIERAFRRFGAVRHHVLRDPLLRRDDINRTASDSPESLLSMDETSMLSPTSSFSSHGEASVAPDLSLTRAQWESKRQREKFLELVRRWEMKQPAASSKLTARVAAVHIATRSKTSSAIKSNSGHCTASGPTSPKVAAIADLAGSSSQHLNSTAADSLGPVEQQFQELVGRYESTPSFKLRSHLPWTILGPSVRRVPQLAAMKSSASDYTVGISLERVAKKAAKVEQESVAETQEQCSTASTCTPVDRPCDVVEGNCDKQ